MSQCKTFTGWPRVQCIRYEGHDGDHKFPGDIVVVEAPAVLPHRLTPNETSERNEDWRTRALTAEELLGASNCRTCKTKHEHIAHVRRMMLSLVEDPATQAEKRKLCEAIWLICDDLLEGRKDRMQGYAALRLLLGVDNQ